MFLNMKLLAHHSLNGFGGMGEGMSMQLARDGRQSEATRVGSRWILATPLTTMHRPERPST